MIMNITPDNQKANALIKMAEITIERLNETDLNKYPSNTLTDYYNIIHKLMEALSLKKGIKIRGEGAHQELIDYTCKNYGFTEYERGMTQEMKIFRNRISYEGFMVNKEYIKTNESKIKEIINKILIKLKEIQWFTYLTQSL